MTRAMHDSHISGQKVSNHVLENDTELSPDSMKVTQFVPPAALAPFVTHVYFFRSEEKRLTDQLPAALGQLLFLLKGSATLQFQGGDSASVIGTTILGPGLGAAEFTFNGPFYDLGFALSPLGFVALTGRPANQFADRAVPASELFGPEIDTLAQTITARFADGTMRLSHHALPVLIHWTRQMLWRLLAAVSVLLGVIGAFLPVLPTVPFLLLAAWAAGRGWPALVAMLLAKPKYGPHIPHWRVNGGVPRRAKWLASVMMLFSATTLWFSPVPPWVRGSVWLILVVVASWLWTRPEPAGDE